MQDRKRAAYDVFQGTVVSWKDNLEIFVMPSLTGYFRIVFRLMQSDQATHTEWKFGANLTLFMQDGNFV